jgi:hypothetical protein
MLQRQLSHLNGHELDRHQVITPLIFSLSGFVLSYAANIFIFMILYDFCLLPAQFSAAATRYIALARIRKKTPL